MQRSHSAYNRLIAQVLNAFDPMPISDGRFLVWLTIMVQKKD